MNFTQIINTAYRQFTHLISPPFCASCRAWLDERDILCDTCTEMITPLISTDFYITKTKSMPVFCVGDYTYPLKQLILAKGYGNRTAARQLGELIWRISAIKYQTFDYIIPVPLHWTRYAWRGFNQAHEIARVISMHSGKPIINVVKRIKRTQLQSSFGRASRTENVQGVFTLDQVHMQKLKGKRLLLVDDVMTTGATLQAVTKTVFAAHPDTVIAVVGCRVK